MKLNILLLALFLFNISLVFAADASSNKLRLSKRDLKKYLNQKREGPGGRCPFIYCVEDGEEK